MFRTAVVVCLTSVCALHAVRVPPAAAQDMDQGFRDAHAIFGNVGTDVVAAQLAMEELLPALEGRWLPVDTLAGGGPTAENANSPLNDYERSCSLVGYDLRLTSRLSFEMVRNNPSSPDSPTITYRFDYSGYNGFVRSRDTGEFLTVMGLHDMQPLPPSVLSGLLSQALLVLYHPNRHTMVLVNIGGRTEYYGRCP
jgi:hypothetical protein